MPAEPHEMTFPPWSVIVTIVLLKLAWMWTCPWGTFFRSRRRCLTAFLRSAMCLSDPSGYFFRRTPTVFFGPRR